MDACIRVRHWWCTVRRWIPVRHNRCWAQKPNGYPEKALNFMTPHQKWGIHSTYSDNQLMLTLGRGGPVVWLSGDDARSLGNWRITTGSKLSTATAH